MKIRVFRPLKHKIGIERYEDITEHGCHPDTRDLHFSYIEKVPIFIDVELGDIIEVDGLQYFYAPSGIELYEPIGYGTLEEYIKGK